MRKKLHVDDILQDEDTAGMPLETLSLRGEELIIASEVIERLCSLRMNEITSSNYEKVRAFQALRDQAQKNAQVGYLDQELQKVGGFISFGYSFDRGTSIYAHQVVAVGRNKAIVQRAKYTAPQEVFQRLSRLSIGETWRVDNGREGVTFSIDPDFEEIVLTRTARMNRRLGMTVHSWGLGERSFEVVFPGAAEVYSQE